MGEVVGVSCGVEVLLILTSPDELKEEAGDAASAAEEAGDEVAGEECIVNGSTGDILLLCVRVSGDCIFLIIILFCCYEQTSGFCRRRGVKCYSK